MSRMQLRQTNPTVRRTAIRKTPMTATEIRLELQAAIDGVNHFIEKHKDVYLRYKDDFHKIGAALSRDPSLKKQALEDLALSKYPRLFSECVERYSKLSYWTERASKARVDDAIVSALPDDVPGWLAFLRGSDHKYHPEFTPVKGKTYLPRKMV